MTTPLEPQSESRAHLRYRRVGGGYRADDVEQTLTGLRRTVRRLESELEELRARAAALEADLAVARVDLETHRTGSPDLAQALEEALRRAAEIEELAHESARQIVAAAEERAASVAAPEAGAPAAEPGPDDWPPQIQVFETRLELDAGPFADSDALSAFERSLAGISCVDDVYVRSLAEGRAAIEVILVEPTRLVPLLRESLPYDLHVRGAAPASLVLDVRQPSAAALVRDGPRAGTPDAET
jgi:hypothetical protein